MLRQLGLDTVLYAACGAAPLPPEILLWYRKLGLNLAEGYGMTETLITHLPAPGIRAPRLRRRAPSRVWKRKVSAERRTAGPQPDEHAGLLQGPGKHARVVHRRRLLPHRRLWPNRSRRPAKIIGRVKEQFKTSKGKYVAPAPIEGMLSAHPEVEACCLMGAGMPAPFAFIVIPPEMRERCADDAARKLIEESLHAHLREMNARLEPFERVNFIVIVRDSWTIANGMITPTLKIRRSAVEGRYQAVVHEWRRSNAAVLWESPPPAESSMAS